MARNKPQERKHIPAEQLTVELQERMARIAMLYNDLKDLSSTVHIPHTVLPSLQSTTRFLQIAGDHIQAAITLSEIVQ